LLPRARASEKLLNSRSTSGSMPSVVLQMNDLAGILYASSLFARLLRGLSFF
jgi:hypothetical protein